MRGLRGNEISMIFQEPMTSLNPVLTIGRQIGEARAAASETCRARRRASKAVDMLRLVAHPGAGSGGRRNIRTSSPAACASAR